MSIAIGGSSTSAKSSHGPLWVDVRDFGAKADSGATDNSVPFQAAVDYLASVLSGSQSRGIVFIPSAPQAYCTYKAVWVDAPNIEIQGEGWGSSVFNLSKQPAFIFGIARSQPIDGNGTMSTLIGNKSYRPDSFGKLDTSAAPTTGVKWGIRTNGNSIAQFQGCPLSSGVGSSTGLQYSDNWTETSKLTLEFCVEPPDGQLFPAGYPLLGLGDMRTDPAPFFVGVADNNQLFVTFRTSDMVSGFSTQARSFWIDLTPFTPPYRIAIQIDIDNAVCTAFINGTQVTVLNPQNLSPTSAYPFVANSGLRFIVNDHYPFMIGAEGLFGSYDALTGIDLRIYGLRLSNTIRYQSNGVAHPQVRADSPGTALNDAWAYFGQDANTIAFLAGTDNPATSGRNVTVQNGTTAVFSGQTWGLIMNTQGFAAEYGGNAIRNVSVQGSTAYGQVICLGGLFDFTIENVKAMGGFHGIGSFTTSSTYYVYLRGYCVLEGTDAGYFGALQLIIATDYTEFPTAGRVSMRFAGCNARFDNTFFSGWQPTCEGFVKARSVGYGGNFRFSNMLVDFEGYSISHAAIYCETHQQTPATSLILEDIFFATIGPAAALVMLRDVGPEDGSRAKAYCSIDNMTCQSTYSAALDIDGPLWHVDVKGGALNSNPIIHRQTWGTKSNAVIHDARFMAPPRQFSYYNGSHVLEARSPADGQFSEWRCVQTGTYGTSNPPAWIGLNPVNISANGLAAYVLDHTYMTAAIH